MDEKKDFFDIDDEFNKKNIKHVENIEEEVEFEFENEEQQKISDKEEIEISENYKRTKDDITDSVDTLKGNINSMLDTIKSPDDMFLQPELLPGIDIDIETYDYDREMDLIKVDSKETLESLANLYLDVNKMKNKNIHTIIKNDSKALSDLNFSISMAKRGLIMCMQQLDLGVNDPDMFQSVSTFQKEIRDTIKMVYDIQRKMKDFYKELKSELPEINAGEEDILEEQQEEDHYTIIGDPKLLNQVFDELKKDPTLLNNTKDKKN